METAIKVFDFACGGDIAVQDLTQAHVIAFHELCSNLPNRWGKTRDERTGGLPASLAYAEQLCATGKAERVGLSIKTIEKYITWILSVLKHVSDEDSGQTSHAPVKELNFRPQSFRIGKRLEAKHQRARDQRPKWQLNEMVRLLSAPISYGCLNLDERFKPGRQIYHDA